MFSRQSSLDPGGIWWVHIRDSTLSTCPSWSYPSLLLLCVAQLVLLPVHCVRDAKHGAILVFHGQSPQVHRHKPHSVLELSKVAEWRTIYAQPHDPDRAWCASLEPSTYSLSWEQHWHSTGTLPNRIKPKPEVPMRLELWGESYNSFPFPSLGSWGSNNFLLLRTRGEKTDPEGTENSITGLKCGLFMGLWQVTLPCSKGSSCLSLKAMLLILSCFSLGSSIQVPKHSNCSLPPSSMSLSP